MSVLSARYARVGTMMGQPVFVQEGECTDDGSTITSLRASETGRVQLEPIPRLKGLVAKHLDTASPPALETLNDPAIGGSHANCMQMGKTEFAQVAPVQPAGMGSLTGKTILAYKRTLVQMFE